MHVSAYPWLPVAAQCLLALAAMAALALAPPARGTMLIVSLAGEDAATIAGWAATGNTRILGTGPLPGSLVVAGDRDVLLADADRHRGLLLLGPAAECGQLR